MASAVTMRRRKFIHNKLLNRKQMILDVMHPNRANVSKAEIATQVAKQFEVNDEKTIFVFGFRTAIGGQKSSGFCLIYDTLEDALSTEPKYRLLRAGVGTKKEGSRKMRREAKNKKKKQRGTKPKRTRQGK
jgi:small subunit ribosomal protein S24e